MAFLQAQRAAEDRQAGAVHRRSLLGLTAWQQHCALVKDLQQHYGAALPEVETTQRTDLDDLIKHHRFIRREEDDRGGGWEVAVARKYYSKLFREYAVIDLSHHKSGIFGLRWRTKKEVVDGKGQFGCGERTCPKQQSTASYELPFTYKEDSQQKTALVKVRLCPEHVQQLLYRKTRDLLKQQQRAKRKQADKEHRKAKRRRRESGEPEQATAAAEAAVQPSSAAEAAAGAPAEPDAAAASAAGDQPVEAADTLLADTVAEWGSFVELR